MKKYVSPIITLVVATLGACYQPGKDSPSSNCSNLMATKSDSIARGKYLVIALGCNDCHSAKSFGPHGPELDTATLLAGYPSSRPIAKAPKITGAPWVLFAPDLTAAVGPWGMSFAANITSDETGIGTWSEGQFITALRKGKYMGLEGSRQLLPPMPWQGYSNLTDDDIKAIFQFLKSTKPVHNIVPAPITSNKL